MKIDGGLVSKNERKVKNLKLNSLFFLLFNAKNKGDLLQILQYTPAHLNCTYKKNNFIYHLQKM